MHTGTRREMENYLLMLFTSLLQYACAFILSFKYTGERVSCYKIRLLQTLPLIILSTTLQFFTPHGTYHLFINIIFMLLTFMVLYRYRIITTIMLYSITILQVSLIKIIINIFLRLSAFKHINAVYLSIVSFILVLVISVITDYFFDMHKMYETLMSLNRYIKTAWACTFIAVLAVQVVVYARLTSTADIIILFTLIILILFINFDGIFFQVELDHTKKELETYEQYMPIIEELTDYIRIRQHDFDNCLQALQMFPVIYEDYDSLVNALKNFEKHTEIDRTKLELLKINLKLVAGFLISKSSDAKNYGKNVEIKIKNYNLITSLPQYTLIELFGILMDNALEAISEGETVFIELDTKDGQIIFNIKNKGDIIQPAFREAIFQKGFSTKNPDGIHRGIGLYKLKKIVDSNNGMLILDNEMFSNENYISFTIII